MQHEEGRSTGIEIMMKEGSEHLTSSFHAVGQDVESHRGNYEERHPLSSAEGDYNDRYRPRSTKTQWVTVGFVVLIAAGIVILIGVTSATNKKVVDGFDSVNKAIASNSALGLPGYESLSWDDILAQSVGQTVNLYSQNGPYITLWFTNYAAPQIMEKYGITLNVNPSFTPATTSSILDRVESDIQSGNLNPTVDMVWMNGNNFLRAATGYGATIQTSGYLYGPWANKVPSAENFNWKAATIAYDFGYPTGGKEMPVWSANWNLIYRADLIRTPPTTFSALTAMVNDPTSPLYGKFTYATPSSANYIEAAFIRHFLYENCYTKLSTVATLGYALSTTCSNDYTKYLGNYNPSLYDANVGNAFQQLRILESGIAGGVIQNNKANLYNRGYCDSNTHCAALFKAGKINAYMAYSATTAGGDCANVASSPAGWAATSSGTMTATVGSTAKMATPATTTVSTTTAISAAVTTLTLPSVAGIAIGSAVTSSVSGAIAPGTYVSAVSSTANTVTLTIETQAAIPTGSALTFTAFYVSVVSTTGITAGMFASTTAPANTPETKYYVTYVDATNKLVYLSNTVTVQADPTTGSSMYFYSAAAQPCGVATNNPAQCSQTPITTTNSASVTNSAILAVAPAAGITAGMSVSFAGNPANGDDIPSYTTVVSISSNTLSLSNPITITTFPVSISFIMHCTTAYIPSTTGAMANNNFVSIMSNSPNKLAAMVAGNYIGSIEAQFIRRSNDATPNGGSYRWVEPYDPTCKAITEQGWDTAFNYLATNVNYKQTPGVTFLRAPYSLSEIDARYGTRMNADWATCVGTPSGQAYATTTSNGASCVAP